ncbi:hypothetical protein PG993_001564 [Apiospora rasikravindrae]|uniref:Uncharacterized protein n=1 Tax=Apiospora rasikravindrae TaxID=990691 RepID=A0ABR1UBR7_9PEZI
MSTMWDRLRPGQIGRNKDGELLR